MPIFRLAEFNFKTKFYNNLFGSTGDQSDTASFLEMDDYGSSGSQMGGFDAAGGASGNSDAEMQKFLMMEQQRAEFQGQVHRLNDTCWELCMEKPSSRLDSRTENCMGNCVNRFIDVTLLLTNRFAQMLEQSGRH